MALEHDSQGFLVGDPIDLGKMPTYLLDIKRDVAAIRNAVIPPVNSTRRQRAASAPTSTPQRDASGRFVSQRNANVAVPTGSRRAEAGVKALAESIGLSNGQQKSAIERMRTASRKGAASAANGRDAAGRFVGGEGSGGSASKTAVSALANQLSKFSNMGAGLEDVDPSVKAFREVAEPMKRGIEFFSGGKDDKQTSWLKKIFKSLNFFHKEDTVYNKAAKKTLKSIEEKTGVSGGDGGSFSGAATGSIVGRIVPWLIGGIAGIGGAIISGIGAALAPVGSMLLTGITTVLGAVFSPIGLAIGAAAAVAWGLFTESGQKFFADAGEKIAEVWNSAIATFKESFPGVTKAFSDAATSISNLFEPIANFFKDKLGIAIDIGKKVVNVAKEQLDDVNTHVDKNTGVNLKDMGAKWLDRTKANASEAFDGVKSGFDWLGKNADSGNARSGISELIRSNGKNRAYRKTDGTIETREGGSRSWRNNNPGNMEYGEFAKKNGAIGSDGRFAIFPSLESGRKAKENLIFKGKNYRDLLLKDAIARYAPNNENDTKGYQDHVLAAVGGKNSKMSDYSPAERTAILSAIEKREGFKPGKIGINSTTSYSPPKMPTVPAIADAPQVLQPLGSPEKPSFTVNMPSQDVGQNISDRGMAHIVTGGMGFKG